MPNISHPVWIVDKNGHDFLRVGDFVEEFPEGFRRAPREEYRAEATGQKAYRLLSDPTGILLPFISVMPFVTKFNGGSH